MHPIVCFFPGSRVIFTFHLWSTLGLNWHVCCPVYLWFYTPSGRPQHSWEIWVDRGRSCVGAGMTFLERYLSQRRICSLHPLAWFAMLLLIYCVVSVYLKPQFSGISSFRRTSLRLPFGQYSVTMATLGASTHPPINLHRLGWSSSLKE